MDNITSSIWWKAAGLRAARTALVVALPYIPITYLGNIPYITIGLVCGLAIVLSFLTSLTGISEVSGVPRPWWYAVLSRVIKTVAQAAITGIGAAVLITDVQWDSLLQFALTAGFGSLVLALLGTLPEAEIPIQSSSDTPGRHTA